MHLLDHNHAADRLDRAFPPEPSLLTQSSTDGRGRAPSMDHLDALEAQSIYIFREAFARLKKLALLWSLGKDSNVMIWLARKAFFGRVPFPALHVDTGKKFPEMYAFRDRYGKEWELDLKVEPCPPLESVDATLPLAARHRRRMGRARPASGILGSVQRLAAAGGASARASDPAMDRSRHLGLHQAREHSDHSALSGQ